MLKQVRHIKDGNHGILLGDIFSCNVCKRLLTFLSRFMTFFVFRFKRFYICVYHCCGLIIRRDFFIGRKVVSARLYQTGLAVVGVKTEQFLNHQLPPYVAAQSAHETSC